MKRLPIHLSLPIIGSAVLILIVGYGLFAPIQPTTKPFPTANYDTSTPPPMTQVAISTILPPSPSPPSSSPTPLPSSPTVTSISTITPQDTNPESFTLIFPGGKYLYDWTWTQLGISYADAHSIEGTFRCIYLKEVRETKLEDKWLQNFDLPITITIHRKTIDDCGGIK